MPDGKMMDAQAVAMRISGDKAAFHNCKFIGYQDTLCDDRGRHFFKDCFISGTVDFIFGNGKSLYLVLNSYSQNSYNLYKFLLILLLFFCERRIRQSDLLLRKLGL